jgi:hypothetical protein
MRALVGSKSNTNTKNNGAGEGKSKPLHLDGVVLPKSLLTGTVRL